MLRFWVWYHYWPWSSQLVATFANWHQAEHYRLDRPDFEFTIVDTQYTKPI